MMAALMEGTNAKLHREAGLRVAAALTMAWSLVCAPEARAGGNAVAPPDSVIWRVHVMPPPGDGQPTLPSAGAPRREPASDARRRVPEAPPPVAVEQPAPEEAPAAGEEERDQPALVPATATTSIPGLFPTLPVENVTKPTAEEQLLVELVNVERTKRGLNAVAWDGQLAGLARLHDGDMRAAGRISHHSTRDGADFTLRLARTTYRAKAAAENVAFNSTVLKAHRALMNSPGHRRNILDPELTAIGAAVVTQRDGDWVYVVEDFATPIARLSDEQAADEMRRSIAKAGGRWRLAPLVEDTSMSGRLDGLLERMISSGSVNEGATRGAGEGWTLAFTSSDPASPPPGALSHVPSARSYALAVSFRKTPRYPFGTYWAILFLKDAS